MQGNQQVEKFKKKHRVTIEGSDVEATITRGKKLNKPNRGGGVKGAFRNCEDSYIDKGKLQERGI